MTAHSWRKIDYGLRPAKHVERKMLAEALGRLPALGIPLKDWRYVGLGGLAFKDFALFHRRLGIHHMHSIDKVDNSSGLDLQERFRKNAPFSTELHFGSTTTKLPDIPWDKPAIVWLDYDGKFDKSMFQDLDHVVSACTTPTVLLVTLNVAPGAEEGRVERFVDTLGSQDRLPTWVKGPDDLGNEQRNSLARAVREVMTVQLDSAVQDRGGGVGYEQLFNFRYNDGVQMLTFGGVISVGGVAACMFHDLPYVRPGAAFCDIEVPVITLREGLLLEAALPSVDPMPADLPGISKAEVASFKQLYRYMPAFVDADL